MPKPLSVDAQLTLTEGMQLVGKTSQSGIGLILDAHPEFGGQGTGYRPTELLLLSLGGCTGMDVLSILRKKRQDITGFTVNIKAERAPEHPRRYTDIHLEFVVEGHGVSEEAVARSIELSQTKYCSVTATLNSEMSTSFKVLNT